MKSQSELNELKRQWLNDPCWDIEDTEGFEAHVDELLSFRLEIERVYEDVKKERIAYLADEMKCSPELARVIEGLQLRIADLEKKVNEF